MERREKKSGFIRLLKLMFFTARAFIRQNAEPPKSALHELAVARIPQGISGRSALNSFT